MGSVPNNIFLCRKENPQRKSVKMSICVFNYELQITTSLNVVLSFIDVCVY